MKKKLIVLLFLCLLLTGGIMLIVSHGRKQLLDNITTCIPQKGTLVRKYHVKGEIKAKEKHLFFNGSLQEIKKQPGERVLKDEVILVYENYSGKKVSLKSPEEGLIGEITNNMVTICLKEKYLAAEVNLNRWHQLNQGQEVIFRHNERPFLATVTDKGELGREYDGEIRYPVYFALNEGEELLGHSQGLIEVEKERLDDVIIVSQEAIYENKEGWWLVSARWLNDLTHPAKYLTPIEIIASEEGNCAVNGIGILEKEMVILTPELKELLDAEIN